MRRLALVGLCILGLALWQGCDPEEIFEATVTVSATQSPGSEGGQDGEFTVQFSLSNSTENTITVPYSVGGTATAGADYAALSGSLSIEPGESAATLLIDITDDEEVEEAESVIITLNDAGLPEGVTLVESALSDTLMIEDNDVEGFTASISASVFPDSSGEGSQVNLTFTLDQSNSSGEALLIPILYSGTATQNQDYVVSSDSVYVLAGEVSASASLTITDDDEVEDTETIIVTLDSENLPEGISIGETSSVTIQIGDNDEEEAIIPAVSVAATTATGTEGGENAAFTFSLDTTNLSDAALSIPYTISGTATADEDYTALSGTVSIASGATTATVEIAITDDDEVEEDETVTVTIDTENLGDDVQAGSPISASVTIEDNDEEPLYTIAVSVTTDTASEEGTNGEFAFTLDTTNQSGAAISIPYTVSGTALADSDYTALSGTATIAEGESSATVTVVPQDDEEVEDYESVVVTIDTASLADGVSGGDSLEATLYIADNDVAVYIPTLSVTASAASAAEGGTYGEFTFTLDTANTTGEAISIPYTVSGTATADSDYTALSGSVTIADGDSEATATVTITDDTEVEEDETVIVTIDTASLTDAVQIGSEISATVTIEDNDEETTEEELPSVTVSASTVTGVEGGTNGEFTFSLDTANTTGEAISIPYTVSGTATADSDYTGLSGSVTIADGDSEATATVTITDDTEVEEDETVIVTIDTASLTDAVQIGSEISATVTIEDNDKETTEAELPSVTVSASAASAAEDGTNGEFTFTLDSANTTGEAISIPYTVSGTATSDTDYTALSGSVDIASGETTATVEVTVTDDTSEEEDETVIVTVDTANLPSTVTAGTTLEATVTITDNDFETTVQLAATDNTASEDGDNGEFTITLAKANDTGSDISILYTIGGTATNGTDYSTLSGTVDIADGQTSATIAVTITDDSDDEDDEYVSLTIDTGDLPTGISAGTTISDTLTIADNDFVTTAEIEVTDSTATEDGNNAEFTITLAKTNDTGATISIPYTVGGTATDGTDYTSLSGSVDIADGASSATIAVTITDDSDDDDDETVTLTLDTDNFPTGITGGTSTSASVTITDNDFVTTVTITAQDDTGTEGSDDGQFVVALGKSNDTGSSLTIPYTVSGTATEGTDYASLSGSVTIDDGQTQATILIDVTDDSDAESNETVTLTLDDGNYPTGISSGTSTEATVNIIDDDVASPTITFGTATGNSITIDSWTDVGADGYVIYISRANNISDLTDGDDPVESTTYGHNAGQPIYDGTSISSLTVTLLEESKTYYFRVFPYTGSRDYDVSYGAQSTATTTCETTSTTDSQVCWSRSAGTLTVTSNQLPGHSTGSFPNADVTAIEITADMDATPSQASDTTYVYQEDGGATPSNAFYRFGFASNGLGYNPMGLKPWTNDTTGEENWEWQEQLTAPAAGNHIDDYGGHVTSAGKYHYHGDMVGLAPDEDGTRHSLLYGYAADGFPIYYKYSYSNPTDPTSSIVELKSSYQLRSGSRGGDDSTAPSGTYDGTYIQDYEWVDGLGDLDECNGRYGVTPEYPNGTYYYVITADFPVIPNCFTGTPNDDFQIGN